MESATSSICAKSLPTCGRRAQGHPDARAQQRPLRATERVGVRDHCQASIGFVRWHRGAVRSRSHMRVIVAAREREMLFFVPSSIGSLLRCFVASVSLSCLVSRVCGCISISWTGAWRLKNQSLFVCRCERARESEWIGAEMEDDTLDRDARIEVSCSSLILVTIECKYSRAVMAMAARSCPSSARKATNQASSSILLALRSITIMIASSSLMVATTEYNHGR